MMSVRTFLLSVICVLAFSSALPAQGLIWELPPDGSWVRFEGTYEKEMPGPQSNDLNVKLQWTRHLVISSVGSEMAEFAGEQTACRWLEFKTTTGKATESGIAPGVSGPRIYKVLVPEKAINGELVDQSKIPVTFLPIVKGYRKVGDRAVEPLKTNVLRFYPMITMLEHYTQWDSVGEPAMVDIPTGAVTAQAYKGTFSSESTTTRSKNEGTIWRTKQIPFGVAKWTVDITRDTKGGTQPRSEFKMTSRIHVEMSAHEVGQNAETELPASR
ncbi:hypothetical protein FYZ48_09310 [Gimesia chilikensis]|uniref:hypothetical protein n=1 Tax=Gimesia chilikensis TaxID=2605989 RepID=UPI0011F065FC|nr:hypothetical protein [Gimesia chilikensis]KAA0140108.1 hypothetical protein FYZ48_09310 [Gimesia chilikensis]